MTKALCAKITVLVDDYAGYDVRNLYGQHGLSIHIEYIDSGGKTHRVLFDTGQSAEAILHNARLLGIDLSKVEVIVLSHNHYDHTGGLLDVLKKINKRIPVILHPDALKPSVHLSKYGIRSVGMPFSIGEIEKLGDIVPLRDSAEILPGMYFLGEIPRYMKDLANPIENLYIVVNSELKPHSLKDDTGIAIDIEGLGQIIISGCSHSGIVNIAKHSEKIVGNNIYAIIGGLHLVQVSKEKINETINYLRKELSVREVHIGHCTGLIAEYMFLEEYKDKFFKIRSGYSIEFRKSY